MNYFDIIKFKYPHADIFDFFVIDDNGTQSIVDWNVKDLDDNNVPEPTEEDLLLWHQEMINNPKSNPPTVEERITALENSMLSQLGL